MLASPQEGNPLHGNSDHVARWPSITACLSKFDCEWACAITHMWSTRVIKGLDGRGKVAESRDEKCLNMVCYRRVVPCVAEKLEGAGALCAKTSGATWMNATSRDQMKAITPFQQRLTLNVIDIAFTREFLCDDLLENLRDLKPVVQVARSRVPSGTQRGPKDRELCNRGTVVSPNTSFSLCFR